jgi:hypothetical protein
MRIASALLLGVLCWPLTACAHRFRVDPVDSAPMATTSLPAKVHSTFQGYKAHSSLQGLNEPIIKPIDCAGNGAAEVITSRNFGQRLVSVASLGFYDPVTIELKCAKDSYLTSAPF